MKYVNASSKIQMPGLTISTALDVCMRYAISYILFLFSYLILDNARLGMAMKVEKASVHQVKALLDRIEKRNPTPKRIIPEEKLQLAAQGSNPFYTSSFSFSCLKALSIWKQREMEKMEIDPLFQHRPAEEVQESIETSSDNQDNVEQSTEPQTIEEVSFSLLLLSHSLNSFRKWLHLVYLSKSSTELDASHRCIVNECLQNLFVDHVCLFLPFNNR